MKNNKLTSMVWAILAATALWVAPVWAAEQDTGYPWFGDITEDNKTEIPPSQVFHSAPVVPSEEDTGYPWFADIREDKTIMKPLTIFKTHPQVKEGDTGYPWHADIKEDNSNTSQPGSSTQ